MIQQSSFWRIVPGSGTVAFEDFVAEGRAGVDFEIGDLASASSPETVKELVQSTFADLKKGTVVSIYSQLNKFRFEMAIGHRILMYSQQKRMYKYGVIKGNYEYLEGIASGFPHSRKVEWEGEFSRERLSPASKNSLGSALTLFELASETVSEIEALISGAEVVEPPGQDEAELEEIKADVLSRSQDFISDALSKLSWEQMQDFIAGLLRAMGYRTQVSPRGPDRGRDIIASPDGLGLENPRIVVEVKHRTQTMGSQDVRSFIPSVGAQGRGIFVSTGGFSKEARYEAERAAEPLVLIDTERLIELIYEYYDQCDVETRAMIPLRKVYWPI